MKEVKIGIVGGGAAGVFAAIRAAEIAKKNQIKIEIKVFEASSRFLSKVLISGGGRCNVTFHCFEPKIFCKGYPRGEKELISPMHQFQAKDTFEWFEMRGVKLKVEEDGRIFPTTDQSDTIVDCLLDEAKQYGIELLARHPVEKIKHENSEFILTTHDDKKWKMDRVLIATGSSPVGYKLAKNFGHTIEELAPSLFSFNIQHPILKGLEGVSFPSGCVELILPDQKRFLEKAPILITHWGLSGPGILKISAWAARDMKKSGYKAKLIVNWIGVKKLEETINILMKLKEKSPKGLITNSYPKEVTRRFWEKLLEFCKIPENLQWANLSKTMLQTLAEGLCKMEMNVDGKSRNKEEFVECGGVSNKEINWKTMESKKVKGLFFAGEVMDVDGITGGFNLQHAWTSGWICGTNIL